MSIQVSASDILLGIRLEHSVYSLSSSTAILCHIRCHYVQSHLHTAYVHCMCVRVGVGVSVGCHLCFWCWESSMKLWYLACASMRTPWSCPLGQHVHVRSTWVEGWHHLAYHETFWHVTRGSIIVMWADIMSVHAIQDQYGYVPHIDLCTYWRHVYT